MKPGSSLCTYVYNFEKFSGMVGLVPATARENGGYISVSVPRARDG